MDYLKTLPPNLLNFILVTLFSLIIGLEQRKLHVQHDEKKVFGTDRTFTFIGILGFILFILDETYYIPFLAGGAAVTLFLGLFYRSRLKAYQDYGITTIVVALITYCMAPLIITQPKWFAMLVLVTVIVFSEMKASFIQITEKFEADEFITAGKFIVIAGVILPIVPDSAIVPFLTITPYKIWLAVVVISSISYASYLLKKFVFKNSGIIFSGILGGLYSSTATTLVLARKSKANKAHSNQYAAAIILATAMMYFRILVILFIFNKELATRLSLYFVSLGLVSVAVGIAFAFMKSSSKEINQPLLKENQKNPLELKVALIFTLLYVAFTFITYFTIQQFGTTGLNLLSFVVGLTDIDPFLINLFQGKYQVATDVIAFATIQAIISNNFIKTVYACVLGNKTLRKPIIIGFLIVIIMNIVFDIIYRIL